MSGLVSGQCGFVAGRDEESGVDAKDAQTKQFADGLGLVMSDSNGFPMIGCRQCPMIG